MADTKDFIIEQGKTFVQIVRWSKATPIVYKAISAITQAAPARITSTSHGVPNGWKVAVVSVKGMTQINAEGTPPKAKDYRVATVVDANTIELNEVNSSDYKAYVSGGYIQYQTPTPLLGYTARMTIKDKVGGTELLSLTTENTRITVDDSGKTITLTISATDTELITWKKGVYELEMVSGVGFVSTLLTGTVTVAQEITT